MIPISKREAQDFETVVTELATRERGKLYRNRGTELAAGDKLDLRGAIEHQIDTLEEAQRRGRIDLNDAAAAQQQGREYMAACAAAGFVPSMMGFAVSLGYSRQRVYRYMQDHPTSETTQAIEQMQSAWAAILSQQSLTRQTDNATSIFLLKNSHQGLTDKMEITAVAPADPLGDQIDAEAIAARYTELPED